MDMVGENLKKKKALWKSEARVSCQNQPGFQSKSLYQKTKTKPNKTIKYLKLEHKEQSRTS
ncbi:hypothetical protein ACQP3D_30650, partial [Escherichia coli]